MGAFCTPMTLRAHQVPFNLFQVKARPIIEDFHPHPAIVFGHPHLDEIPDAHGVAQNILQDDLHGILASPARQSHSISWRVHLTLVEVRDDSTSVQAIPQPSSGDGKEPI